MVSSDATQAPETIKPGDAAKASEAEIVVKTVESLHAAEALHATQSPPRLKWAPRGTLPVLPNAN